MAEFPTSVFTPRATENLPGLVFDPADKKNLYSEDFQALGSEINAIETVLEDHFVFNVGAGIGLKNIPVSPSGLSVGDIWIDTTGGLNILKIVL